MNSLISWGDSTVSQFEVVGASLEFIRNFCLQGVQTENRALQLHIPFLHLQSHTLLFLYVALGKTLQKGREAEVPPRKEWGDIKEHTGWAGQEFAFSEPGKISTGALNCMLFFDIIKWIHFFMAHLLV